MGGQGERGEASAVSVRPGEGTTVRGPVGGPLTFKVRGEQSDGRLTALENVIAPGEGPPLHRHANEDETWQVLEGQLFDRFATLPEEADPREAFRSIGADVGMDVIGPPLAQSHPA